uniref:WYL domain-containing protein n=1 Tax=Candidatus Caldatribacterium californiense TaxID=1454726 RepID=A0A7V4DF20_9BACT
MSSATPVELNREFVQALELLEQAGQSVFITGRAGTGKSTLLRYFREHTKKNIAVLAPTGVAALNVQGQTIHSFFRFRPDVTPETAPRVKPEDPSLYRRLDTIIIDEISMVRADLLDCVDAFLRVYGPSLSEPFGGVQMVFVGDLYQLPPVVKRAERLLFTEYYESPYFFSAFAFREIHPVVLVLNKVYRQSDPKFVELLNRIRNNTATDEDLALLNARVFPDYVPGEGEFVIHLTTTNDLAQRANEGKLAELPGKEWVYKGQILGAFSSADLPTDPVLRLKRGAQVMLLTNDPYGRWVNGTIGQVQECTDGAVILRLESGNEVEVTPHVWDMFEFYYDREEGRIMTRSIGSFTQYPLRLAWAVTIHKSQGLTFDRVVVDLGRGTFAHGQAYVALSRCRTLEGLILKRPLLRKDITMDWRVVRFLTEYQYAASAKSFPLEERVRLLEEAKEARKLLEIVYLKDNDEKTCRIVLPLEVGMMRFQEKEFLGLRAFCLLRKEERTFRVDRILSLRPVEESPPRLL